MRTLLILVVLCGLFGLCGCHVAQFDFQADATQLTLSAHVFDAGTEVRIPIPQISPVVGEKK
jgi:hypothetical protein